jgi:hypothetical protein
MAHSPLLGSGVEVGLEGCRLDPPTVAAWPRVEGVCVSLAKVSSLRNES